MILALVKKSVAGRKNIDFLLDELQKLNGARGEKSKCGSTEHTEGEMVVGALQQAREGAC